MSRAHTTKAAHCAELLREPRAAADPAIAAEALGKAFAAALVQPLASLLGGKAPRVTSKLERADASVCVTDGGTLAAHFLLGEDDGAEGKGHAMVATLQGAAALALCDRAFGGKGEAPETLPDTMPLSASLTLDRLGALLARSLGAALGEGSAVSMLRRSDTISRIVPFGRIAECFVMTLTVSETVGATADTAPAPWTIRLLADVPGLMGWLHAAEAGAPSPEARGNPAANHEIFDDIELPLRATLADIKLPLSRLTRLSPGDEIALPLRRDVPLIIGGHSNARRAGGGQPRIIAHGTVGNFDDRAALRLTRITTQGDRP